MQKLKNHVVEKISGLLSKNIIIYKLCKEVIKRRDNDSNGNMNTNGETRLLRYLLTNNLLDVVFDVGANVGHYFSIVVDHSENIKVYAFEPGLGNLSILSERFADHKNVSLIPKALSNVEGELSYFQNLNSDSSGLNSVYDMREIGYFEQTEKLTVNAVTLDNFCETNKIEKINLMKIDVEGHELAVLLGGELMLKNKRIDYIQFEFGHAARCARVFLYDIDKFMKANNYHLFVVKPKGLERFAYSPFEENKYSLINFFAATDEAIPQIKNIILP
ncbi:MAG: FkbM family methyltransferase [Legionellales bacterium]|nr:FkbM family methyltransferase [Legionellales bacterium]